jgi:hypothetical protein
MSYQLERYFAATLGCAITAMWAAAGFGLAFACLAVALASYGVVALVQCGSLRHLFRRSSGAPARSAGASGRRRVPGSEAGRRRPVKAAARRSSPRRMPESVLEHELDPAEPVLTGPGPYGW